MSANNVGVAESNKFGLKGADQIYITNPYSVFCPVMRFTVYLKEPDLNNPTQCDLFLSKEAIEKLDIKKRDFHKGVFNMKIHIGE